MQVAEMFTSINGEGTRAGELAVFIRFKGCNLCCSYCDTKWANNLDTPFTEMSAEEIYDYVRSTGIRNITLTGGEPLLQNRDELHHLLQLLLSEEKFRVEIETNGSVDLSPYCDTYRPVFTMDWKLPSSGCESAMFSGNPELLDQQDTVKFVAGSEEDLQRAAFLIEHYHLTERCHVYLSPVYGQIEPERIAGFMKSHLMNDVRLQLQIHKIIWDPDRRGV